MVCHPLSDNPSTIRIFLISINHGFPSYFLCALSVPPTAIILAGKMTMTTVTVINQSPVRQLAGSYFFFSKKKFVYTKVDGSVCKQGIFKGSIIFQFDGIISTTLVSGNSFRLECVFFVRTLKLFSVIFIQNKKIFFNYSFQIN